MITEFRERIIKLLCSLSICCLSIENFHRTIHFDIFHSILCSKMVFYCFHWNDIWLKQNFFEWFFFLFLCLSIEMLFIQSAIVNRLLFLNSRAISIENVLHVHFNIFFYFLQLYSFSHGFHESMMSLFVRIWVSNSFSGVMISVKRYWIQVGLWVVQMLNKMRYSRFEWNKRWLKVYNLQNDIELVK